MLKKKLQMIKKKKKKMKIKNFEVFLNEIWSPYFLPSKTRKHYFGSPDEDENDEDEDYEEDEDEDYEDDEDDEIQAKRQQQNLSSL